MDKRRIILIGAARSGTKLIRDSLAEAANVGCVPYDVNFVWRYGNEHLPDDAFSDIIPSATTTRFVHGYVDHYARNGVVIEKTVSNALRVPYVKKVFPDATFVHLIRDGIDAIASTRQQWAAPTDRAYVLKKLRHFPPRLLPGYGRKYVMRLLTHRDPETPRASWGVRYAGIDDDLSHDGLLLTCARQWRYSVESATDALVDIDNQVVNVRYEDLVANPSAALSELLDELKLKTDASALHQVTSRITDGNVGKGRRQLSHDDLLAISPIVDATLERLGYAKVSERLSTNCE